jgi:hypothetical protein
VSVSDKPPRPPPTRSFAAGFATLSHRAVAPAKGRIWVVALTVIPRKKYPAPLALIGTGIKTPGYQTLVETKSSANKVPIKRAKPCFLVHLGASQFKTRKNPQS